MTKKISADNQKSKSIVVVNKHWSYEYHDETEQYNIFNSEGILVAAVVTQADALLLINSVNEYIDTQHAFGTRNKGIPRHSTVIRAIVDSIRKSRQRFDDRALEGVSVYCNYGKCLEHVTVDCPPFDPTDIGLNNLKCYYAAESFELCMPNGVRYKGSIDVVSEDLN